MASSKELCYCVVKITVVITVSVLEKTRNCGALCFPNTIQNRTTSSILRSHFPLQNVPIILSGSVSTPEEQRQKYAVFET